MAHAYPTPVMLQLPTSPLRVRLEPREACPSCGGRHAETLWSGAFLDEPWRSYLELHAYDADLDRALSGARFDLRRCETCEMVFHASVLDAGSASTLYGKWICSSQIEVLEGKLGVARGQARFEQGQQLFKHLVRIRELTGAAEPSVVDFGCGDGRALRMAELLGARAYGIDPSSTREHRANASGLAVWPSVAALREHGIADVDAALVMEVLEHLPDPLTALRSVVELVRPGGVVILEVPNATGIELPPSSLEAFRIVQPLEHVNAFTPSTLATLAERAGLEPAPRIPCHATAKLTDVLLTELTRWWRPATTSQYYVRI